MDALALMLDKLENIEKILKATQAEVIELKASMSTEWLPARMAAKELGFDGCKAVGLLLTVFQGFVTLFVTDCAGVSSLFWGIS